MNWHVDPLICFPSQNSLFLGPGWVGVERWNNWTHKYSVNIIMLKNNDNIVEWL